MIIRCFATRSASSSVFFIRCAENEGKIYKITAVGKVIVIIKDKIKIFLK